MSFRQWFRSLRAQWTTLVHSLWPPTPQQQRLHKEAILTRRLQHYSRRLLRIRCRLEHLRSRQGRQEERVGHLQAQVQAFISASAGEDACRRGLVLDRACRRLQRTQRRLRRLERLYRRQRDRLDRCKSRLQALRSSKLTVVEEGSNTEVKDRA